MPIRSKLLIVFLAMAVLPLLTTSLISFNKYKNSIEAMRLSQLNDLALVKSERVEEYFSRLKTNVEMTGSFYNIKKNLPILEQFANEPGHPQFLSAKALLDGQLSKTQKTLELSGIVLLDTAGKIVYTSDSKTYADYLFHPLPGPGQEAFSEGKKGIHISDVFSNQSRNNTLEILVSGPLSDFNGTLIGVVAFEVNMAAVNRLIQDTTGLGQTGETLVGKVVGDEVVFLNPLRHDPDAALKRRVRLGGKLGGPVQDAALGKTGSGQLIDYRGTPVIAAWKPIPSSGWGMVAKIDTEEAFADVMSLRKMLLLVWGVVLVSSGIIAYFIANSISGPLKALSEGAAIVGQGDLDHRVAMNSKDEVGQLSRSFDKMIDDLKGVMASRDELNKEVTERKQAEVALHASEERWATTLSSIGDGVIATDIDQKITFMNAVAESLTGWSFAEANNVPITDVFNIVNEQTRQQVDNPAILALETNAIVALANHTLLIRKDQSEVPIDDAGSPIRNRDGQIIGSVLIFRDITERKQAEKAKNNFIAILAHELRNPLAPLLLSVQKLKMHVTAASGQRPERAINPVLKETTGIALHQIDNMSRLLDDLLDVSRIERGKIQLKVEKVDVSRALEHAVVSARSIIDECGHELALSLPAEPVVIEADPVRLEQIIVNILNNAAKYTDYGGHIWLTAERNGSQAQISIKDDGMGIAADKLQYIFEPFYQTEMALYRANGGLGLGLMLVKNLLKMHNGSIEVKSLGEGKGSEFIVSLPALPAGSTLPKAASPFSLYSISPTAGCKKKILVVDDNPSIAGLMRDLFEHFGHEVVTAHEGRAATRLASEIKPDVVLCDIGLPGMDGYEVARTIRQSEQGGKRIVMVAVTGFGQESDRQLSCEAGFDHHLVKPVGMEALLQVIDS